MRPLRGQLRHVTTTGCSRVVTMPKHVTLPTPRMKSRSSVCGYTNSSHSYPRGRRECANVKFKDTISYTSHGTIANLNTFTIANEQSMNVSLSLCEPIDSLPCVDNVLVENVDTLVDPIDDRIDSSSKIDLCPPSVDTYALNASSLFFDHSLCKYNILFEDDKITPSDVPSGENHESSIVLDNYTCYNNPLWYEAFPPKDGNLFLENESTLVGKIYDDEEGGVCFPIPFSSWCVPIVNGMTYEFESISSHTHENILEEVELPDTFLYYLFTYDDAHGVEWSMLLGGQSAILINGGALDLVMWAFYPF
uniref:Uncharacterized protein n=1 Tax=Solanum tuberosum TaxID=4113 RepID=M1E0C1_SOLTU